MQHLRIHIDEAGRGPLAGPVFVGLTMSLCDFDKSLFQDSKQLSEKKRNIAYTALQDHESQGHIIAAAGRASNKDIDKKGIIPSLQKACHQWLFMLLRKYFIQYRQQALLDSVHGEDTIAETQLRYIFTHARWGREALRNILHIPNSITQFSALIIDGNHTFWLEKSLGTKVITVIKGDSKNPLISAASIIAKVERDAYMTKVSKKFPKYNFAQHKWYGTKVHRAAIAKHGMCALHRQTFCSNIVSFKKQRHCEQNEVAAWQSHTRARIPKIISYINQHVNSNLLLSIKEKPKLLLHICCAPDLSRPLLWLKEHFKLYLFWYNPNIHPRAEHTKRYDSFIKLIWLEKGDYEIIEDRYDPKEFFAAMIEEREDIDPKLKHATTKAVLAQAGEMEERSSRCNPCYSMRLAGAAKNAAKHDIPYFTSTLLISPKKKMDKLMRWWLEGERRHPTTKFLWFDFAKNKGYEKATQLTKKHDLFRQNYCGCGWTIPKKGEVVKGYVGG